MIRFLHLHRNFAIVSDGEKMMRIDLTDRQMIHLAAEATKFAADILEKRDETRLAEMA